MHLESLTINNYRKFGGTNNTIHFVGSSAITASVNEVDHNQLIGPSSTLIIGKNNSGKTTIARGLELIRGTNRPKHADYNLSYLKNLFDEYYANFENEEEFDKTDLPELSFQLDVKVNFSKENSDLVNNLYQFIIISSEPAEATEATEATEIKILDETIKIIVKYKIAEELKFRSELRNILNKTIEDVNPEEAKLIKLHNFYELLDNEEITQIKKVYLNSQEEEVSDFSLAKLIDIKEIKANRHLKKDVLTELFKNIVRHRFSSDPANRQKLIDHINSMNLGIGNSVKPQGEIISKILHAIEPDNHIKMGLSGNVDEELILSNLIKYTFNEGGDCIPEDQFGLGYINLLNIIGEVIKYIDDYEDSSQQNRINLLFIEEPESFMHPQMQEFFINRIDNAIYKALSLAGDKAKSLYCQIVITTHSSHIVNSKIHTSNSFDNINYITSLNNKICCVKLNDTAIKSSFNKEVDKDEALAFIKKHIKYKVSELFFSDAVIFVEGAVEETLLPYFKENDADLNKYYVSIFNINGAHTKLYFPLIKQLKIPCLVISDIDIERTPDEKGESNPKTYTQINSLENRSTTNETLKSLGINSLSNTMNYHESDNLYVVFQKDCIEGQFATSFEEAFILSNHTNDILNYSLKKLKPKIYEDIVGKEDVKDLSNLIVQSYKLQRKLSDSKSDFANTILYKCIVEEGSNKPVLPKYILDGLKNLKAKLSIAKVEEQGMEANAPNE